MSQEWEDRFAFWTKPPSDTEAEEIENAERVITNALGADDFLKSNTKVFVQGSYRNDVNVRRESDIDLCVMYTGGTHYPSYPPGMSGKDFGLQDATYKYAEFKARVERALVSALAPGVSRGNKAIDVHANTYRVNADVVPVFPYKVYGVGGVKAEGVRFVADDGATHTSWPTQHSANSGLKDKYTGYRYKPVVRILKRVMHALRDEQLISKEEMSGHRLESLLWNVPNALFAGRLWDETIQDVLHYLWSNTGDFTLCGSWQEVSGMRPLLSNTGDAARANQFLGLAWNYVGVRKSW